MLLQKLYLQTICTFISLHIQKNNNKNRVKTDNPSFHALQFIIQNSRLLSSIVTLNCRIIYYFVQVFIISLYLYSLIRLSFSSELYDPIKEALHLYSTLFSIKKENLEEFHFFRCISIK